MKSSQSPNLTIADYGIKTDLKQKFENQCFVLRTLLLPGISNNFDLPFGINKYQALGHAALRYTRSEIGLLNKITDLEQYRKLHSAIRLDDGHYTSGALILLWAILGSYLKWHITSHHDDDSANLMVEWADKNPNQLPKQPALWCSLLVKLQNIIRHEEEDIPEFFIVTGSKLDFSDTPEMIGRRIYETCLQIARMSNLEPNSSDFSQILELAPFMAAIRHYRNKFEVEEEFINAVERFRIAIESGADHSSANHKVVNFIGAKLLYPIESKALWKEDAEFIITEHFQDVLEDCDFLSIALPRIDGGNVPHDGKTRKQIWGRAEVNSLKSLKYSKKFDLSLSKRDLLILRFPFRIDEKIDVLDNWKIIENVIKKPENAAYIPVSLIHILLTELQKCDKSGSGFIILKISHLRLSREWKYYLPIDPLDRQGLEKLVVDEKFSNEHLVVARYALACKYNIAMAYGGQDVEYELVGEAEQVRKWEEVLEFVYEANSYRAFDRYLRQAGTPPVASYRRHLDKPPTDRQHILALDIGGTSIKFAFFDKVEGNSEIIHSDSFATDRGWPYRNGEDFAEHIKGVIFSESHLLKLSSKGITRDSIAAIGCTWPGAVSGLNDHHQEVAATSGILRLFSNIPNPFADGSTDAIQNLKIRAGLERVFNLPVALMNDGVGHIEGSFDLDTIAKETTVLIVAGTGTAMSVIFEDEQRVAHELLAEAGKLSLDLGCPFTKGYPSGLANHTFSKSMFRDHDNPKSEPMDPRLVSYALAQEGITPLREWIDIVLGELPIDIMATQGKLLRTTIEKAYAGATETHIRSIKVVKHAGDRLADLAALCLHIYRARGLRIAGGPLRSQTIAKNLYDRSVERLKSLYGRVVVETDTATPHSYLHYPRPTSSKGNATRGACNVAIRMIESI